MTAPASHLAQPAVWRGMTGMDPNRPVATVCFMLFDGTRLNLVLSDMDLQHMVRQVIETVPQGWAQAYRILSHPVSDFGKLTEDGLIPRAVDPQAPDSSFSNTSSGKRA